jgi:hypothetical protein
MVAVFEWNSGNVFSSQPVSTRNTPPAPGKRTQANFCSDSSGNLWMYGGLTPVSYLNTPRKWEREEREREKELNYVCSYCGLVAVQFQFVAVGLDSRLHWHCIGLSTWTGSMFLREGGGGGGGGWGESGWGDNKGKKNRKKTKKKNKKPIKKIKN